jgi:SAM-dependent methyltransferase
MGLAEATWDECHRHLGSVSQLIAQTFATASTIEVLEAGCGSATHLEFPTGTRLTGIDISPLQLARNTRLNVRIQADLETHRFEDESFDVIVCWDVIEHLERPGQALDSLAAALRKPGLLILGFPNRASLKGLMTRALPYRAHVLMYRWLLGKRDAGRGDVGPFPTPMRREMDLDVLKERLLASGLELAKEVLYESPMMAEARERLHLVGKPWELLRATMGPVIGRTNVETTDCILVFRNR